MNDLELAEEIERVAARTSAGDFVGLPIRTCYDIIARKEIRCKQQVWLRLNISSPGLSASHFPAVGFGQRGSYNPMVTLRLHFVALIVFFIVWYMNYSEVQFPPKL